MNYYLYKRNLIAFLPLLFLVVCGLSAQKVKISEVGYNTGRNAVTFGAIIEIQNYGNTPIDITGYSVEDPSTGYESDNERTYLSLETVGCSDDMILEPNEVVSVFRFLNKNSQTIHLYTKENKLLSSVTWGNSPYFVTASEMGIWSNGPTPIVPEGGAIVNIGDGTSWLDWVAVSERTPCVAENNSGQTERKNILVFQAESAKKAKAKVAKDSDNRNNRIIRPNKKGAYLEWNIDVNHSGDYDVFLSYSNEGEVFETLKGTLTVNDKNNSLVQFEHTTVTSDDSNAKRTWLNEFTKIHLEKGMNTVRFTATDNLKNNQVFIDYLGLVVDSIKDVKDVSKLDDVISWMPEGYCRVQSSSAKDEWIANFALGSIDNNSGSTVFTDFSQLTTELISGNSYDFRIVPAWSGTVYNEGYAVWIDYNGNGNFDDEGEKVVSRAPSRVSVLSGSFTVPNDAVAGATKIRVMMKYNGEPTLACSPIENGEIEDYTAMIKKEKVPVRKVAIAKIKPVISLFPLPVTNELNIDVTEVIESLEVLNMQGQQVLVASGVKKINMQSLAPGNYILIVKTPTTTHTKKISRIAP